MKNLYGLVDFKTALATNATPIRFLLSISYSLRPFCAKGARKIRFIGEIFFIDFSAYIDDPFISLTTVA